MSSSEKPAAASLSNPLKVLICVFCGNRTSKAIFEYKKLCGIPVQHFHRLLPPQSFQHRRNSAAKSYSLPRAVQMVLHLRSLSPFLPDSQ